MNLYSTHVIRIPRKYYYYQHINDTGVKNCGVLTYLKDNNYI